MLRPVPAVDGLRNTLGPSPMSRLTVPTVAAVLAVALIALLGYGVLAKGEDTSLDDFYKKISANLFGTIIVTKAAIPVMR